MFWQCCSCDICASKADWRGLTWERGTQKKLVCVCLCARRFTTMSFSIRGLLHCLWMHAELLPLHSLNNALAPKSRSLVMWQTTAICFNEPERSERGDWTSAALKSICSTPPSITCTSTKEQPSAAAWGQSWVYSSVLVFLNTPLTLHAVLQCLTTLETQQKGGPVHGANTVLFSQRSAHWKGIDSLCLLFSVHCCSGTELFTHITQTADM